MDLDLTNPSHLEAARSGAEALEAALSSAAHGEALEAEITEWSSVPLPVRVAMKLAISRLAVRELADPVHVSVAFAVYKEHLRLQRPTEHRLGEDALREKLRQLRWLFSLTPWHTWDLTVVDDGCPAGSGSLAEEILGEETLPAEQARVLYLEDAIRDRLPVVSGLTSVSDSQKGGSIRLALWRAGQESRGPNHVAVFTDADLSTHLGQIGLLLTPILDRGSVAAVGSRREPLSVVVKSERRDQRGKLFIYLWKRLLPQLAGITDTQCGFKAFSVDHLRSWIGDTRDSGFSFDIEALLRIRLSGGFITKVPIAWIDSETASTTVEHDPYLTMLESVARVYRRELPRTPESEPFAQLIAALGAEGFDVLSSRVPDGIGGRDPGEFDDFDGVSAAVLAHAAGIDRV